MLKSNVSRVEFHSIGVNRVYLPLEMSVPIMIGGVIKHFISKKESKEDAENEAGGGVLFCSGLIAGEGIIGIVLAILSFGIVCAEKKSGSK